VRTQVTRIGKALRARMTKPDAAVFLFPRSLPPLRFMHQHVTHLLLLLLLLLLLPMRLRRSRHVKLK